MMRKYDLITLDGSDTERYKRGMFYIREQYVINNFIAIVYYSVELIISSMVAMLLLLTIGKSIMNDYALAKLIDDWYKGVIIAFTILFFIQVIYNYIGDKNNLYKMPSINFNKVRNSSK